MLSRPPRLPRQHGAWVMLAIPLLLGLALTRGRSGAAWWVVPGFLLAFLAQDALLQWAHTGRRKPTSRGHLRRTAGWGLAYLSGSAACFLFALWTAPAEARPSVLAVAVPAAVAAAVWGSHSALHRGRALWSELIGMAGMTLAAPLMATAAGMPVRGLPMGAAATAYAYCLSTVTCVRTFERRRAAPRSAAAIDLAAHVVLFAAVALLSRIDIAPPRLPLSLVPVAVRVGAGLAWPPRDLRALGRRELWVASSFTLVALASFWLSA